MFNEQTNKKSYWINELKSLGISPKEIDWDHVKESDCNTNPELPKNVENIKRTLYQEYKIAYSKTILQLEVQNTDVV